MRELKEFPTKKNSLCYWWKFVNPLKVAYNFILIYPARFCPSLTLKRFLLRLTGMRIGKDTNIGLGAMFDIFYPENIEIGENTIIGFNSTVLAHEFLMKKLRVGKVRIGNSVLIGANTTILPGVEIGDNAKVSAMSLVNKDVEKGSFVGGIPIKKVGK